jgi:squalene-hopene/tetraprenyl-beta-curcumene cyclase
MPKTRTTISTTFQFADHGALLDPPTEDVSARCVSMLAQLGDMPDKDKRAADAVDYLRRTQHPEGSWYGRWGMNYIYGTWSVPSALNAAGHRPQVARDPQGGELAREDPEQRRRLGRGRIELQARLPRLRDGTGTPSQTAWAVLGLMAAGEIDHPAVARGIDYLSRTQGADGLWDEPRFTAVGFPRIFYLRYHGYAKFFPVWAMARYRNLKRATPPLSASACNGTRSLHTMHP